MSEQESHFVREAVIEKKSPCLVTFYLGDEAFKGTSLHFNERGMLVMCKNPAPLNAKVRLILQFPGFKNSVELSGDVVWTNIHGQGDSLSPKGMGLRFTNIEREMERLLSELAGHYESFGSIYSCYYT